MVGTMGFEPMTSTVSVGKGIIFINNNVIIGKIIQRNNKIINAKDRSIIFLIIWFLILFYDKPVTI